MKHSIFLSRCFSEDSTLWFPSRRQQEPQRWARRHRSSTCSGGGGESGGKKELERPQAIVQQKGRPRRAASQLASWLLSSYFCLFVLFFVVFFLSFLKWTASSSLSGRLGLLPVQKAYTRRRSVQICWADSSSCSRNISRAAFSFQNLAHTSRAQTSEILAIH